MDPVAKTSLLTAAMRAQESKRNESEGRLVYDPYAENLAGTEGLELMRQGIEAAGDQPAIAVRTRFIDDKIEEALQAGVRQIVILAAGMDTRAYRLTLPEDTRIFELDRPEVLAYKHEKLGNVQPNCTRKTLALDLRDEWRERLLHAGFNQNEKTLWLVEGLIMYLEESQVGILFSRINRIASVDDILVFDVLSQTLLEAPFMKNQLEFLIRLGAPWRFGMNEPEQYMDRLGWKAVATQPGEFAPSRWPFPPAPRSVPNVPRSFFVKAIRYQ